ncbi:MAG: hypothetical protein ABR512_12500 [Desulfopila sp.]
MISHVLPGRIRLRHAAPLSPESLAELTLQIQSVVPSGMLNHNPQTGSTLILFAEKELTSQVLSLFPTEKKALCPVSGSVSLPALRWPHMRHIKRGMTVSLLTSLGLLVLRREGSHAAIGGVFLSFLGRHLWVYRKRIWK